MSHAAINEVVAPKSRCPVTARDDVRFIEDEVGAPAELISTGPRREETIVCRGGLPEGLLADRFSTVREAAAPEPPQGSAARGALRLPSFAVGRLHPLPRRRRRLCIVTDLEVFAP